jgi:hypothetical protein
MYKTGVLVYASGLYEIQHTWQIEKCLVMMDSIKMMCTEKFLHQKL